MNLGETVKDLALTLGSTPEEIRQFVLESSVVAAVGALGTALSTQVLAIVEFMAGDFHQGLHHTAVALGETAIGLSAIEVLNRTRLETK